MTTLKVSILCITYNHEQFIRQSLESFMMQKTDFDFEVIIGEDCSLDNTKEIIKEFEHKYPNIIKPIYRDKNIGFMQNFIDILYRAKGKYIALCEGDDYWTDPVKLQKQVDFLEANEDFSLCFTKVGIYRNDKVDDEEHKKHYHKIMGDRTDFIIEDILKDNFIATCSVVFRRINLLNYPDWTKQLPFGDWPLNIINSMHGKIKYIDKLMSVYRIHDGGIWSTKPILMREKGRFDLYLLISKYLDNKYDEIIIQSISETAMEYVKYSSELIEAREWLENQNKNKDKIISETQNLLSQKTAECHEVRVSREQSVAHQSQEIERLNEVVEAKDVAISHQAQEIDRLNEVVETQYIEMRKKEEEILSVHQSKWFRVGNALKMRPMTLHNFTRIVYLIAGLIIPKTLHAKVAPIVSKLRQQYLNARQVSLEKMIENGTYLVKPPAKVAAVTEQSHFLSTSSDSPYKVDVLHLGINSKILLVLHEFSRTGAPYAVLYLARALFSLYGVRPAIISPKDGLIRVEFEQEGFPTIVDPLLFDCQNHSSEACNFVANFERVIVTSLGSFSFISNFKDIAKHLTWWIHETDVGFNAVANMTTDLPLLFAACESIWLGSPLCFPLALRYISQDKLHLLLYGCPDTALPHRPHKSGEMVFSIIGAVEPRKRQDVFLDAIKRLPKELRGKAIFRIIGSPLPYHESVIFYKKVSSKAAHMPEIEFIENMPSDRLLDFYAETDVLVSASRDDPMPIVITQGLMFSKVCLCSSAIGHAQLLEDKKDSLIFTNESAEELSEKMAWLLQNPTELAVLGMAGRLIYEKYFLMSRFANNVGNLIHNYR